MARKRRKKARTTGIKTETYALILKLAEHLDESNIIIVRDAVREYYDKRLPDRMGQEVSELIKTLEKEDERQ